MAAFPPNDDLRSGPQPDWAAFRALMPVTRKWAYFDHAAVAPLPTPARDAIERWLDGAACEGDTVWPSWVAEAEEGRGAAARLIHADPAELAWIPNTTTGISLVAEGFPWQAGDNVVLLDNEFPSNQYPWLHLRDRGVEARRVAVGPSGRVEVAPILEAMDSRTRIVSVSWVGFATGWRLDLEELVEQVHRRGALVFLDAIQGLGVFSLDVAATPVDFLAADGHKWLLGPEGAGLFYLRREHLDLLRPLNVGWNSVVQGSNYSQIELKLRPSAARYEGGSQNLVGVLALSASLKLLEEYGARPVDSAIGRRVLEVTDIACEMLRSAGATICSDRSPDHASGIVSFDWPGVEPLQVRRRLLEAGVVLSCRGGHLRIAPHAYNDRADFERLVDGLKANR